MYFKLFTDSVRPYPTVNMSHILLSPGDSSQIYTKTVYNLSTQNYSRYVEHKFTILAGVMCILQSEFTFLPKLQYNYLTYQLLRSPPEVLAVYQILYCYYQFGSRQLLCCHNTQCLCISD